MRQPNHGVKDAAFVAMIGGLLAPCHVVARAVMLCFVSNSMGGTYGGNSVCAAAANATIDVILVGAF